MKVISKSTAVRVREIISETDCSIKFRCPSCSRKLEAEMDMFGDVIPCPCCNKIIVIPSPTVSEEPRINPLTNNIKYIDQPARSAHQTKSPILPLLYFSVAVSLGVFVILLAWTWRFRELLFH